MSRTERYLWLLLAFLVGVSISKNLLAVLATMAVIAGLVGLMAASYATVRMALLCSTIRLLQSNNQALRERIEEMDGPEA